MIDVHGYDFIVDHNAYFLQSIQCGMGGMYVVVVMFHTAWGLELLVLTVMGNSYGLKVWNG